MGLRPTQGDEKRPGPATTLYGTVAPSFVIPKPRDLQCAIRVPPNLSFYNHLPSVISEEDTATTRRVAVINEAFARRFFKNENPLGKHFGPDKIQYASRYEIVGVVKDVRYMAWDYKDPIGPMYWISEAQFGLVSFHRFTPA